MTVNVLMPTLGKKGTKTVDSLRAHAPFDLNIITSDVPGWANAINDCLSRRIVGEDCLIIDDDIEILPETFADFDEYKQYGDVFGFKLMYPGGTAVQHDGGYLTTDGGSGHLFRNSDMASYVGYVTASLCYIKAHVFENVLAMNVWPGLQWEDVAFCVDAWEKGFRVVYVPNPAIHEETGTKRDEVNFWGKFRINALIFQVQYGRRSSDIAKRFGPSGRIPLGQPV